MGKFIDPKEKYIVNKYIDSYLQGTDLYSKYIDNSPTFVTYYSKNDRTSTQNPGLNNVIEIVGNESPLKYNKIENLPLFSLDEIIPAIDYDEETGPVTAMEGSALILPHTIEPLPDDFLMISYHENEDECYRRIFRVDNVEVSSLNSKKFYRISYSVEDVDIDILENRQVEEEFGVVYENIGTEKNSVIIKSDLLLLDEFEEIKDKLFKDYYNYFYLKNINSFCYNENSSPFADDYEDTYLYNPYLARFIRNNNIFIEQRTFLKNLFIEDLLDRYDFYKYTIYYLLENCNDTNDNEFFDSFGQIDLNSSIFSIFREKFMEVFPFNNGKNSSCNCFCKKIEGFFDCDIKKVLDEYENINSIKNLDIFERLFIMYIKDFNNIKSEDFLKEIKNIKIKNNSKSYNFTPIIFFIIDKIYERIFLKS